MNLNQRQKAILTLGIALIAIVILSVVLSLNKPSSAPSPQPVSTTSTSTPTTTATTTTRPGSTSGPKGAFAYQDAVKKYEGKRIQFDNCTSLLGTYTFKSGTVVMLDGRSPDPQVIAIGTKSYTLNGFDYKIVTLPIVKKPLTIYVDCEMLEQPQYNIATIKMQP